MITGADCIKYIEDIDNINALSFAHPWSRRLIEEDMANPNSFYVVEAEGDRAIGYGAITVIAGEANVTNIATHPDYRRQGVGIRIMNRLIRYCTDNSLILITLEVRKSNSSAVSLYEKSGFVIEGERKGYYADNGEDALIMTLRW